MRNKIAHFGECEEAFQAFFNHSPNGIIKYFDETILGGGDLIFCVWEEINGKFKGLSKFWVKLIDEAVL